MHGKYNFSEVVFLRESKYIMAFKRVPLCLFHSFNDTGVSCIFLMNASVWNKIERQNA